MDLPLLVIGGGFTFAGAILYGAWLLGRYRGRDDRMPEEFAQLEYRVERMEQVLSQVTGALDRLEASHRQAVLILTERPRTAPNLLGRVVTPH